MSKWYFYSCSSCDKEAGFFGVSLYYCVNHSCGNFKRRLCIPCWKKLKAKSGIFRSRKCPQCKTKLTESDSKYKI